MQSWRKSSLIALLLSLGGVAAVTVLDPEPSTAGWSHFMPPHHAEAAEGEGSKDMDARACCSATPASPGLYHARWAASAESVSPLAASTAGGPAFAAPVQIVGGGVTAQREPTLQIGRDGTLLLTDLSPAQIGRSTDRGATWSLITPPLSGGGDLDGAQDDSASLHVVDLNQSLKCLFYYRSSDGGNSFDKVQSTAGDGVWRSGDAACTASTTNVDRPWVATWGFGSVYIAYNLGGAVGIDVSRDGGETFAHATLPNFALTQNMAVDPADGTLYLIGQRAGEFNPAIGRNRGREIVVASSSDARTFSLTSVITSDQFDLAESTFSSIAVDSGHNVYAAWSDNSAGTVDVYVSVSRDRGTTWSPPARVSHDLTVSIYPTLVAGDPGRVAVSWYGTPDLARHRNDAPGANWYVYAAVATDADRADPSFTSVRVTEQPFHHGSICAHSSVCEGLSNGALPPGYEKGILDLFQMAADPSGALNVVWPDSTKPFPRDFIARQSSGSLLKATSPRHRAVRSGN